jgi:hypothetical protein
MAAPLDVPAEVDAGELYADASAKTALYARLSRNAAGDGDAVLAVTAAWAADVAAVQALWWERARDAGSGPIGPFLAAGAAIGAAVDAAMDGLGGGGAPPAGAAVPGSGAAVPGSGAVDAVAPSANGVGRDDPRTARGVVESARRGMLAAFDPPAAMLVAARLATLEHLAGLPAPGYPTARTAARTAGSFAARVRGREMSDVLADLRTVASDCRTVARALAAAGFGRDAVAQTVLAETAVFEAYLLQIAGAVGDAEFLGADLRRAALADVLPATGLLPEDLGAARAIVRDAMRTVLGAGEAARLGEALAAFDATDPAPLPLPADGASAPCDSDAPGEPGAADRTSPQADGVAEPYDPGAPGEPGAADRTPPFQADGVVVPTTPPFQGDGVAAPYAPAGPGPRAAGGSQDVPAPRDGRFTS